MIPKFCVVDDDPDILDVTGTILKSLGCEAILLKDGYSLLELLKEAGHAQEFDAIFLDIMMPGISGLEVLEKLKSEDHTKDIPVIMLTAKDRGAEIITGYQLGAHYYITKPFSKDQLVFGIDLVFQEDES